MKGGLRYVKKIVLIALVLVVIGGVGIIFIAKLDWKADLTKEVIEFDFEKIDTINVKTDNAAIEIMLTNKKSVTVKWKDDESKLRQFTADIKEKTLVVVVKQKRQKFFDLDFLLMDHF